MKKTLFLSITLLLSSLSVQAAWFEVTGQAVLLSSKNAARTKALQDAVFQALHHTGADLSTYNYIAPLLTENKESYLFSGSEVREITVADTRQSGGNYYVTARIDINPTANTCHKIQYKKNLLMTRFKLDSPQQASLGGIYQIHRDYTDLVERQFSLQSQSFTTAPVSQVAVSPRHPERVTMLAQDHNAQFVVAGHITDLSATVQQQRFGSDQIHRQFGLEVFVYDGRTGEVIMQKNYRDMAEWGFEKTSVVDTKSARFWYSGYGEMLQRNSRQLMLDLEQELACRASLPEVVKVSGNTAQINLGRSQGVKSGDILQLWHHAAFVDQYGQPRNQKVKSDITLVVKRVYENSAELRINQPELANSIQIGDFVSKSIAN